MTNGARMTITRPSHRPRRLSSGATARSAGPGFTTLVFLVAAIGLSAAFRSEWRPLSAPANRVVLDEDFDDHGAHARAIGQVDGSGGFSANGITIAAGQRMDVRLPVSRLQPDEPVAKLWLYDRRGLTAVITCAIDGRHFVPVATNVFTPVNVGVVVPLTPCRGAGDIVLAVHVEREAGAPPGEPLVLDKIQVVGQSGTRSWPGLIPVTSSWLVVAVAIWGGGVLSRRRWIIAAAGSAAFMATAAVHALMPAAFAPRDAFFWLSPVIVAAACALAVIAAIVWRRGAGGRRTLEILAFCLVLVWAFSARWHALVAALDAPLSPDAETVSAIVHRMHYWYDTQLREPLWPWLVRVCQRLVGDNPVAGRVFSLATSLLLFGMTAVFARVYLAKPLQALAVCVLLAVHPALVASSVDAHRTDLFALTLVIVAFFACVRGLPRWIAAVGLALGSTLTALTQLTGVIPAAAAIGMARLKQRVPTAGIVLAVAVTVAAVLPYGIYTHRTFTQAFYFTRTLVPTFYRNYEFMRVTRTGCDGCPTEAQLALSSYSGRRINMFEYLFELHAPREVIRRITVGYAALVVPTALLRQVLGWSSIPIYLCYLIGLGVAAFTRARELLLVPALSVNLLAFVIPLGIDSRLVLHLAPFAAILIVMGAAAVCRGAMWLWSPPLATR